jgi:hypothetical protein
MGSDQSNWASFNIGEFIFPRSRWSIFPILVIGAGLLGMTIRNARLIDETIAAA